MKEPNGVKQIELDDSSLLFPANYKMIFVGIYLLLLPYVSGILYLFFHMSDVNFDTFSNLKDSKDLLNCCIVYEALACVLLLLMMKSLFKTDKNKNAKNLKRREN